VQRIQEGRISPERKARLDELGFIWDALTHKWEEGYQHLEAYVSERGDCKVTLRHRSADGFRVGVWVNKQRQKRNKLSPERKARLDALGFIWDRHEALWEEGFDHLQAFVKENKHCEVSDAHVAEDGYPLGQWVRVQRRQKDRISAERKTRLDALGFIWDVLAQQWEVGFQHLAAFVRENEHCRVLATHVAADGYPLGQWVKVQRRRRDTMPAEQKARLDGLGFVWGSQVNEGRSAAE
jgi:Fe2+ transport system protein FeoA